MKTVRQLEILDRDDELRAIRSQIDAVADGRGGSLIFEGASGIGRSHMLAVLAGMLAAEGITTLHARGSHLEQTFPFGVARQWFESTVAAEFSGNDPLAGAARLAKPLFDCDGDPALSGADETSLYATLHGLYRLCVNLAGNGPVALLLDDAQWADASSLRFLHYLCNRLDRLAIVVAVAVRTDVGVGGANTLALLSPLPTATTMRLQPLSEPAVRKWVADTLGNDPDEAFVAECFAITGGNPFMAKALLDEAARSGLVADVEAVRRLRALAPHAITRHVAGRLQWLPSAAHRLARAMSILGDAEPAIAARLAGVPEAEVAGAAFTLESAGILKDGKSLSFTHPVMRIAVAAVLTPAERNRDHLLAARVLTDWGAPTDLVAEHLLAAAPAGDEWVVRTLRTAAQHATDRQDYSSAKTYLARALRESISRRMRVQVLREIASADVPLDDADGIERLYAALDLADDADEQVAVALQLVPVLISAMRSREAVDLLTRLRANLAGRVDRDLLHRLDIEMLTAAGTTAPTWPLFNDVIGRLDDRRAHGAGTVRLRLYRAIRAMLCGAGVAGIAQTVEQLLDDPNSSFGDEDSELQTACLVGWALVLCDRPVEAERWLSDIAPKAAERGYFLAERSSLALLALAQYAQGRIADAQGTAGEALGRNQPAFYAGASVSIAAAVSVHSRLDRGDIDGAQAVIRTCGFDGAVPRSVASASVLEARGRLRIMQERWADGLADLETNRRRVETRLLGPAIASWPYGAAAQLQQGRRDDAMSWARIRLRQAKMLGVSREIGRALRVIGLLTGEDLGLEILSEAVDVLADSPARVEYATALVDYGAALRRANQRIDARSQLKAGLALARECGAGRLSDRAVEELDATGLPGRAFGKTGVLTTSERRVADMAAFGMRNRDIALRLYVTVKTVEWHLSQVYRKLGIRSRAELRDALNNVSAPPLGHCVD